MRSRHDIVETEHKQRASYIQPSRPNKEEQSWESPEAYPQRKKVVEENDVGKLEREGKKAA